MPGREKLPSTLERSPAKAQRTWFKTHDHAVEAYGEGERAHRTAFAALQARRGGRAARESRGETFGTVDVLGASKEHLDRAIARTQ